jgi:hypothetical protein
MHLRNVNEARSTLDALRSYRITVGGRTGWYRSTDGSFGFAQLGSQKRHISAERALSDCIDRCERGENIDTYVQASPSSVGFLPHFDGIPD